MNDEQMLYYLIAFIFGWIVSKQMTGCNCGSNCNGSNCKYKH